MAGIAIASAGSVFSKATDTFWSAVQIFAGRGAAGAAGGAVAGAAGGAATGGAAATAARVAAVGAGTLGLAGGALFLQGDTPQRDESQAGKEAQLREYEEAQARIKAGGVSGWIEKHLGASHLDERVQSLREELGVAPNMSTEPLWTPTEPQLANSSRMPAASPVTNNMSPAAAQEFASALVKALTGQTLRVQSVTPPSPQSQSQPL